MDLLSFAETYLPSQITKTRGITNSKVPFTIAPLFENERSAEAFLSTVWWQVTSRTMEFQNLLKRFRGIENWGAGQKPEMMIIDPGSPGGIHNLIVLDPNLSGKQPRPVRSIPNDLSVFGNNWVRWKSNAKDYLIHQRYGVENETQVRNYLSILDNLEGEDIHRFGQVQNFQMLVAGKPKTESTACRSGIFTAPIGVAPVVGGKPTSSVGAWVEGPDGRTGVTTCLHTIVDAIGEDNIHEGKTRVEINGRLGIIRSFDLISDSCFVEIDLPLEVNVAKVLAGKTPRNEMVQFSGFKSGAEREAFVQGWTMDIPFCHPNLQLRVYTNAVTSPGDSGCPLFDSDGHIIGFAFQRTKLNQQPSYSSWIWAESVFQFHNLI